MTDAGGVAVVATLRETLPQTLAFVRYHLNGGVDHLFIYLDDPADPAVGVLARHDRITCVRCDASYWRARGKASRPGSIHRVQAINATNAMRRAADRGLGWLIHIDADELLHPIDAVARTLAAATDDVIRFALLEAALEGDDDVTVPFRDVTLFRRPVWGRRLALARRLRPSAFLGDSWIRGHTQSKSAVRVGTELDWVTCHLPIKDWVQLPFTDTAAVTLLHYNGMAFGPWCVRWRRRVKDTAEVWSQREPSAQLIRASFQAADRAPDRHRALRALHQRVHGVSPVDRAVLGALGMLARVRLDPLLFRPLL